ncbi:MAG: hypothetical protein KBO60_04485, partial [Achromobacter sp.]|nr:hypothetical protein [Achromobacter sp.]
PPTATLKRYEDNNGTITAIKPVWYFSNHYGWFFNPHPAPSATPIPVPRVRRSGACRTMPVHSAPR